MRSMGKAPTDIFAEFEKEPVASASLGQVHRAVTQDGIQVAVKVLYPCIHVLVRIDVKVLRMIFFVVRLFVPIRRMETVFDQVEENIAEELDYLHEGRNIERIAANFKDDDCVLMPEVLWELTCSNVLTMTYMEGTKISDTEALKQSGLELRAISTKLVTTYFKMMLIDQVFHSDPHPGNIFVETCTGGSQEKQPSAPRLIFLDFGSICEIREELKSGMIKVIRGYMMKDDTLVIHGIEEMGWVSSNGNRELLYSTVRKYFEKFLQLDIEDYSKFDRKRMEDFIDFDGLKGQFRELMRSVIYPEGYFLIERTIAILMGVVAVLDPSVDPITLGFPYFMQAIFAPSKAG